MVLDYVPCTTPLNVSLIIDNRTAIPLHPLDLTAQSPQDPSSKTCIGLIQSTDAQLPGDIVLGVPFLRNTYTVLAFDPPDANGNFPGPANRTDNGTGGGISDIRPRLGLLALTNPTTAMDEFHKVRVLNQPLNSGQPHASAGDGKKLSVGIDVLIGLLSFFAFCFLLFALRWFLMKHGWIGPDKGGHADALRNVGGDSVGGARKRRGLFGMAGYKRARTHSQDETTGVALTEDEMRTQKFEEYIMKERERSEHTTMSSGMTKVADEALGDGEPGMNHQRNLSASPSSVRRKASSMSELPAGAAAPRLPALESGMRNEDWDPPLPVGGVGVGGVGDQRQSRLWSSTTDQPYDSPASQDQRSHRQRNLSNELPLEPYEEFAAAGAIQTPTPAPPPPLKRPSRQRNVSNELPMQPYEEFASVGAIQLPPIQPPPPPPGRSSRQRSVSNELPMQPYEEFASVGTVHLPPAQPSPPPPGRTSRQRNISNELPMQPYEEFASVRAVHLPPAQPSPPSPGRSSRQRNVSNEQPMQPYEKFSAIGASTPPSSSMSTTKQLPMHLKHLSTDQPLQAYEDFSAGGGGGDGSEEMDLDLVTARPNILFNPYRTSQYSSRSPLPPEPGIVHQRTASQLSNPVDSPLLHGRSESQQSSYFSPPPQPHNEFETLVDVDAMSSVEEGGGIMVGVGTAMRGSRIDPKWRTLTIGRDATGSPTFAPVESPITMTDSPTTFSPSSAIPASSRKRHHGKSSLSGGGSRGGGGSSGSISSFDRTAV
jgi:hypothetical protein